MGVLLLVRHGQAAFGTDDYDRLTPVGHAQARHVGDVLAARGVRPGRVVCGSLRRQRETADAIVAGLRAAVPEATEPGVLPDPRWDEYTPPAGQAPDHGGGVDADASADPAAREARSRAYQRTLDEALAGWVRETGDDGDATESGVAGDAPRATDGPAAASADDPGGEAFAAYRARVSAALDAAAAEQGVTVVASSAGTIAAATVVALGLPDLAWLELQRVVVNGSITKVLAGSRGLHLSSFNEHGHMEGVPGVPMTYR